MIDPALQAALTDLAAVINKGLSEIAAAISDAAKTPQVTIDYGPAPAGKVVCRRCQGAGHLAPNVACSACDGAGVIDDVAQDG